MKRLFIGIRFHADESFRDFYSGIQDELQGIRGIRWVPEKNLHFTLKFLGDTEEKRVPLLNEALQKSVLHHTSFSFSLNGTGFFGGRDGLKVVWMGISEDAVMKSLSADIDKTLTEYGFQGDNKKFVPHLTLARVKDLREETIVKQVLTANNNWKGCLQRVTCVELIESRLSSSGPDYLTMKKFGLKEK